MSYAVVWSENGGAPRAGRLDLEDGLVRLVGRPGRELSYDDVVDLRIDRRPKFRLAGRPALVIEQRTGDSFRIASLDGAGTLHELFDRLRSAQNSP